MCTDLQLHIGYHGNIKSSAFRSSGENSKLMVKYNLILTCEPIFGALLDSVL